MMTSTASPRLLVLARHGQSEGNRQNIFTGCRDLSLTRQGEREALLAGKRLCEMDVSFDAAFSSGLSRASLSCAIMLREMQQSAIPLETSVALNERDYGALTGLNKNEARQQFGDEQVHLWRRSYAVAPPNGESLRDTIARVLPYYIGRILPALMSSSAILVVAHGNSLRALILALEGLSADTIPLVELGTSEMRFYQVGADTSAKLQETWVVPSR